MIDDALEEYTKKGFLVFSDLNISLPNHIEELIQFSNFSVKFFESDETTVRSYYGFHRETIINDWIKSQDWLKEICLLIVQLLHL